jgi:hypothetical protein
MHTGLRRIIRKSKFYRSWKYFWRPMPMACMDQSITKKSRSSRRGPTRASYTITITATVSYRNHMVNRIGTRRPFIKTLSIHLLFISDGFPVSKFQHSSWKVGQVKLEGEPKLPNFEPFYHSQTFNLCRKTKFHVSLSNYYKTFSSGCMSQVHATTYGLRNCTIFDAAASCCEKLLNTKKE